MARPMLLMKKDLLDSLYTEWKLGVPVCKLIHKHSLKGKITPPTLTKLLKYYDALTDAANNQLPVFTEIYNSLFPDWLIQDIQTQPTSHRYTGSMPLGQWQLNCWSE